MRTCKKCGKEKPLEEFGTNGQFSTKGEPYRRYTCKMCYRLRRSKDPQRMLREDKYIKELHELHKKGKRRCRYCNKIKTYKHFHRDTSDNCKGIYNRKTYCKECVKVKWSNEYRSTEEYKKKKSEWGKIYSRKNRKKLNKRQKKRYHKDEEFKLKMILRNTLVKKLKTKSIKKQKSMLELVGISIEGLKKYLEERFEEGMSWDNWSKDGWHIDHIIPISAFDLSDFEQQKKCFHYTNLQPLWAIDNIKKSNKYYEIT